MEKKTKNKVLGVVFLVLPFVLLVLILILYTISTFILSSAGGDESTGAKLFKVILGFGGMLVLFLGLPAGIITGIIFLRKKN